MIAAVTRKRIRAVKRKLRNRKPGDLVTIDGHLFEVVDPKASDA